MSERPAIVAFNLERWGQPWWKDREFFLRELALRGWDILWTQGPRNVWTRDSEEWRQSPLWGGIKPHTVAPGAQVSLDIAGRGVPIWPGHPAWNAIAGRLWAARINSWLRHHSHQRWFALVTYPTFEWLLPILRPTWHAFHIFDDWSRNPGWDTSGREAANRLARSADLVTAISPTMLGVVPEDLRDRVQILPHACDLNAFLPPPDGFPEPDELSSIPHPRIGYFGRISRKNDLPLIRRVVEVRSDYQWIFIGKAGDGRQEGGFRQGSPEQQDWEHLLGQSNVHYLGERDRQDLPALLHHMDVNVMCYRLDEEGYWNGVFPLKVFEYLACGRPIVATALASLKPYASVLRLADDAESWLRELREALTSDTPQNVDERHQVAAENTWQHRGKALEESMLSAMKKRTPYNH